MARVLTGIGKARCLNHSDWPPGAGSQGVAVICMRVKGRRGDHAMRVAWPGDNLDDRKVA